MFDIQICMQDSILKLHLKVHSIQSELHLVYNNQVLNCNVNLCVLSRLLSLKFGYSL